MDQRRNFESADGKVAFFGTVRINDYGVPVFRVELADRPPLFGEWQPKFEANGYDFNIEAESFGYTDANNVANLHPAARVQLSQDEASKVQRLIVLLFSQTDARSKTVPFSIDRASFTEKVKVKDGWIVVK